MDETINHRGYTIHIRPDECPESPRAWDNLGIMVCFHKGYTLGDEYGGKHSYRTRDFSSWAELATKIHAEQDPGAVIPLFLYDHSGLTMRANRSFSDVDPGRWDSGQIGFIHARKNDVRKEWKVKRISPKLKRQVIANLIAEVETYSQYLSGDVWYFKVMDANGKLADCVGGFFGYDDCLQQAKQAVDDMADREAQRLHDQANWAE